MKRLILLAVLGASTAAVAKVNATPNHLDCIVTRLLLDEHGASLGEERIESRFDLKAANRLEFDFPEGTVSAFVCNTDPVSTILLGVEDSQERRVAITESHVDAPFARIHATLHPNESGSVSLGISCSAPSEN